MSSMNEIIQQSAHVHKRLRTVLFCNNNMFDDYYWSDNLGARVLFSRCRPAYYVMLCVIESMMISGLALTILGGLESCRCANKLKKM